MDIAEVSKRSGFAPSALRYYEEVGLITSVDRKGLRRQYSANVLEVLAMIALAKLADFRLDELAQLIRRDGRKTFISRAELKRKAAEVDKKIRRLEAARKGLVHASLCPAPNHLECPTFCRLLEVATRKQIHRRKGRRR